MVKITKVDTSIYCIELTRGNTLRARIDPLTYKNGDPYVPSSGDNIKFAIKRNFSDETPLVQIPIDIHSLSMEIRPEDTRDLKLGKYFHDIKLTYANGVEDTFISGSFYLLGNVN